jgi:hypothetical protein
MALGISMHSSHFKSETNSRTLMFVCMRLFEHLVALADIFINEFLLLFKLLIDIKLAEPRSVHKGENSGPAGSGNQ